MLNCLNDLYYSTFRNYEVSRPFFLFTIKWVPVYPSLLSKEFSTGRERSFVKIEVLVILLLEVMVTAFILKQSARVLLMQQWFIPLQCLIPAIAAFELRSLLSDPFVNMTCIFTTNICDSIAHDWKRGVISNQPIQIRNLAMICYDIIALNTFTWMNMCRLSGMQFELISACRWAICCGIF